jgi:hypothetical protein
LIRPLFHKLSYFFDCICHIGLQHLTFWPLKFHCHANNPSKWRVSVSARTPGTFRRKSKQYRIVEFWGKIKLRSVGTMKVTLAPAKRRSFSIVDKAKIVIEAENGTVKGTARKYRVQTKQIRRWRNQGLVALYQQSLAPLQPDHHTTDAVQANLMQDEEFDVDEASGYMLSAMEKQNIMKKRKRITKAFSHSFFYFCFVGIHSCYTCKGLLLLHMV